MKRFCQTLELRDDPELIEKYCEAHAHVWPEIMAGQREVGILDKQIYRLGNRLFMSVRYGRFLRLGPRHGSPGHPSALD